MRTTEDKDQVEKSYHAALERVYEAYFTARDALIVDDDAAMRTPDAPTPGYQPISDAFFAGRAKCCAVCEKYFAGGLSTAEAITELEAVAQTNG